MRGGSPQEGSCLQHPGGSAGPPWATPRWEQLSQGCHMMGSRCQVVNSVRFQGHLPAARLPPILQGLLWFKEEGLATGDWGMTEGPAKWAGCRKHYLVPRCSPGLTSKIYFRPYPLLEIWVYIHHQACSGLAWVQGEQSLLRIMLQLERRRWRLGKTCLMDLP